MSTSSASMQTMTGEQIPLASIEVTSDDGSFCYDLRATVTDPEAARQVIPAPDGMREVEAHIQGWKMAFVIEGYSITRRNPTVQYQLQGRSRSAWLANPHAAKRTRLEPSTRQAIQLAYDELEYLGFDLDYQLANWIVPGGVWGYQDQTPMWALKRIAESVGGFVRSHRHREEVQLVPRYPVSPPDWAGATAPTLDTDRILTEESEWQPDEQIAIAWTMGESEHGVIVRGYRAAWDQYQDGPRSAPPVAYELLTDIEAGKAQARYRIDRSGAKLMQTITVPMERAQDNPEGFRPPGSMIRITDGAASLTGVVRSMTISARTSNGAANITQTLQIETRPEDPEWR